LLPSSLKASSYESSNDKHIATSLRMIGHEVLLNAGDSTSLVLPIITEPGRYKIQFDTEFSIVPDELATIVDRIVAETGIASAYIVELEACETGGIVYSYEVGGTQNPDVIPCKARELPKECFNILFTVLDTKRSNEMSVLFFGILLILFVGLGTYMWKRQKNTLSDPNLIALGDYRLDKLNTVLLFNKEKTDLTSKEAELLILLYNAANSTVEREVILNKVWGDEGDYVGRTLDVFISKLRKKLEADPKLKIVNIRGVGYKLVMNS